LSKVRAVRKHGNEKFLRNNPPSFLSMTNAGQFQREKNRVKPRMGERNARFSTDSINKHCLPSADNTTNYRSEGTMKPLLASLALTVVLTPSLAFPVERDGLTLFFSFEDVREILQDPTPQRLLPPLTFDFQQEDSTPSRIERETRWGGGLGFNGYASPYLGKRPLWGY
jgi:hypothetical protein